MCLDLVFVSNFHFLCVGGGRLACCNLSWVHTRWWFSLVPDPIMCAPHGENTLWTGQKNVKGMETSATERAWDDQLGARHRG